MVAQNLNKKIFVLQILESDLQYILLNLNIRKNDAQDLR